MCCTARQSRTNAVLEHRGAVTGMITTAGYRDIVHIGRHQRPQHYSIRQEVPWQDRPLVRRRHRLTVAERLVPPRGEVLIPLDEAAVRAAARNLRDAGIEAVAICFLFSYLNPAHEARAAELVREEWPECFVVHLRRSIAAISRVRAIHDGLAQRFRRADASKLMSIGLTASLAHAGLAADLHVMCSNGGVATAATVAKRPVLTLLSGPARRRTGRRWSGALSGRPHLITFDVGGTSADIGLAIDGHFAEATARDTWIGGYPVLAPMIDIHTIGAGGGSIAYVDNGGAFRVGPKSAGADLGPAAYGKGGIEPTVTDANLVLGRLDPDNFLGRAMRLDVAAARACNRRAGRAAVAAARRGRRRHPDHRQRQHGERYQLAHRAKGPRSARFRARSPLAVPGHCTVRRWRAYSASRRLSCRPIPASPRPSGC